MSVDFVHECELLLSEKAVELDTVEVNLESTKLQNVIRSTVSNKTSTSAGFSPPLTTRHLTMQFKRMPVQRGGKGGKSPGPSRHLRPG